MNELVFLKLGGSLLTDKTRPQALRADILTRLSGEIAAARLARPHLRIVLGHGSGSFGHIVANQHGTRAGVRSAEQWRGYADTARVAAELNRLVVDSLWEAGVPALRVQPSASALCRDGELRSLEMRPITAGLEHDLVPVIHGDVALDEVRGGTIISTEEIFAYLTPRLLPRRIILVGEVDGVLTVNPASGAGGEVVDVLSGASSERLGAALGGSRGVDVTGGMLQKVRLMLDLVERTPELREVHIVSGLAPGLLRDVLQREDVHVGTRLVADTPGHAAARPFAG